MRCPKCQYLGFEPSPRCKNCGYDFSLGGDDLSSLTMVHESEAPDALADFDLHKLDASSLPTPSAPGAISGGFDLDDLLARGRSEPQLEMKPVRASASTASAVATPPAEDVLRIVEEAAAPVAPVKPIAPVKPAAIAVPAVPVVRVAAVAPAPITTELPLFMQGLSEASAAPVVISRPVEVAPDAIVTAESIVVAEPAPPAQIEEVDDRPLVQVPAVLRPPLAVRRTTPDPARLRAKYARATAKAEVSNADSDLLRGIDEVEAPALVANRLSAEPTPESLPAGWLQGVGAGKRMSAALVDGLLLGSLNAAIVWFTLAVCGLTPADAHLLPLVPIGLFFLLIDGSYLVLFTAACGQTIGKMVAGIRVVGTSTGAVINDRITMGQALARAVGALVSFAALGAGFWMSLVGDHRALHDKIAHTRVVRA